MWPGWAGLAGPFPVESHCSTAAWRVWGCLLSCPQNPVSGTGLAAFNIGRQDPPAVLWCSAPSRLPTRGSTSAETFVCFVFIILICLTHSAYTSSFHIFPIMHVKVIQCASLSSQWVKLMALLHWFVWTKGCFSLTLPWIALSTCRF